MCGVAGIINKNFEPVEEIQIKRMMHSLKHRGPDDEGVFIDNNISLGFVRLSIIDLTSSGHQPMVSHGKRYIIVFNGEIYNYLELRDRLSFKYSFKTATDTEVLLVAFEEWGEDCLDHLNGMFSFVIYDKKEKTIFGARDRFGVKPFYYFNDSSVFLFASEIPALLTNIKTKPKVNNQVVFDYLAFNRTDQTDQTFFENIYKLQHGHKFTLKDGQLNIVKWYDLRSTAAEPFKNPEEFRTLFSDSIKLRLRSDVPVGVCLSGGLDSSSITSTIIKDYKITNLNTFSAVYGNGEAGDESKFINLYKNQLNNMHFVTPSGDTLLEDINVFIHTHAEPIPTTSPYAQFKVMQLASKKVVVTLDGQGADESLAGYHYFFGFYFKELLKSLKFYRLLREMFMYFKIHKSFFGFKTFIYFLLPNSLKTKLRTAQHGYLDKNFSKEHSKNNKVVSDLYDSKNLKEALLNHFEYKLEHLLKWSDRNSMHFSIESRAPFLDYRLVERIFATNSEFKINDGSLKYLLRESMLGVLPEEIRNRKDKVGFETPESSWFKEQKFQEFVNSVINSESFKSRPYFNNKIIQNLFNDHLSGKINVSKEIWKWINLELWCRSYIDSDHIYENIY